MTVRELIERLQKEDPERLVVMSKDAEGNAHSPVSDFWTGAYRAETTWCGTVGFERLTEEDRKRGYDEADVLAGGVPAIILAPVN